MGDLRKAPILDVGSVIFDFLNSLAGEFGNSMIDGIENLFDQAVEGTGSVSHRLCLFCDGFQSGFREFQIDAVGFPEGDLL